MKFSWSRFVYFLFTSFCCGLLSLGCGTCALRRDDWFLVTIPLLAMLCGAALNGMDDLFRRECDS